ncbi:MAG: 3-phosphoshikimate 1-carboxyvinyltransferase [Anaerovoracaceae bacterium]
MKRSKAKDKKKIGKIDASALKTPAGSDIDVWVKNARKNVTGAPGRKAPDESEVRTVDIIPSKSFAHRALICSALSGDPVSVVCSLESKDIDATKNCCAAVRGGYETMRCGESGSTLRFMIPVAGALGKSCVFKTEGRLAERPLSPLREELEAHGMSIEIRGKDIRVSGQLEPGKFTLPGNVSSQFITGLLLALPVLEGDSEIVITGELQSAAYLDITTAVMESFSVKPEREDMFGEDGIARIYRIKGGSRYRSPCGYRVEGDWSGAAFWLAAGAVGRVPVRVRGLDLASVQGDSEMMYILKQFGAEVYISQDDGPGEAGVTQSVTVCPSEMHGIMCDVSGIPDLAPAIALLGAAAEGDTVIANAGRLRLKESDRLSAISDNLRRLGIETEEKEDELTIHGRGAELAKLPAFARSVFKGAETDGVNDHRIVMMEAVASLSADGPVTIKGHGAVAKSYPGFFGEMSRMGLSDNLILK